MFGNTKKKNNISQEITRLSTATAKPRLPIAFKRLRSRIFSFPFVMKKSLLRLPGLLGIAAVCMLSTCKKEDGLPPETQEGANTFGCNVNGKAWHPQGSSGGFSKVYALNGYLDPGASGTSASLEIRATYFKANNPGLNEGSGVKIHLIDVNTEGEYVLTGSYYDRPRTNAGLYYSDWNQPVNSSFSTSSQHVGKVKITRLDYPNRIVSGTFEFSGVDMNGKVVNVSEGRFDLNFNKIP